MKCVLHIGTEKTGTTLIQEWLYRNADQLSQQGLFLSRALSSPNNCSLVSAFMTQPEDMLLARRFASAEERAAFITDLPRLLREEVVQAAQSHRAMVITSEHFHSRLTTAAEVAALADFMRSIFSNITVVCYLRAQSATRTSLYSTVVKLGGKRSLEEFRPNIDASSSYFNYETFLARWSAAFGHKAIKVRLYDRREFVEGDLRKDFLATAGLSVDRAKLDFSQENANESLSLLQACAMRGINTAVPYLQADKSPNPLNARLREVVLALPQLKAGTIAADPATEERLRAVFAESNARVAKRYFGRDELFPAATAPARIETNVDAPVYSVRDLGEILTAVLAAALSASGAGFLDAREIDLLRDVALKSEAEEPVTPAEALQLMQIAHRARPHGPVIRQKLSEWTSV